MYRQIEETLKKWKDSKNKKPLIIKGSRQIGKTYTIRKFANDYYDLCIEINFEHDNDYMDLFHKTRNSKEIMKFIELKHIDIDLNGKSILLFLDEIQACPDAITALKFFKEELPFDVIAIYVRTSIFPFYVVSYRHYFSFSISNEKTKYIIIKSPTPDES